MRIAASAIFLASVMRRDLIEIRAVSHLTNFFKLPGSIKLIDFSGVSESQILNPYKSL